MLVRNIRTLRTRALVLGAAVAIVAVATPWVTGQGVGTAAAAPVTVTGTVSGDHAYDPTTRGQYPDVPSVTVDQTEELTNQVVHVTWDHFTPSNNPAGTFFSGSSTNYAVTVLQCKGTDPADPTSYVWPDFGPDCYNHTPDDASAEHGIGNQAYTVTGADGAGETYFHVETSDENDFLGCDSDTPCSLVVVPNWGGAQPPSVPPGGRGVDCAKHNGDTSFIQGHYALDLNLGGACSWADRIVVPLTFAQTPANCDSTDFAFAAEGAPMISRTLNQWQAGWCTDSDALTFDYDAGTNEYLARQAFLGGSGALTNDIDVALVNRPADETVATKRKLTYAPVANTGIVVAYHVDNQHTGQLFDDLVLNARLVAKLVTQSYSLDFGCVDGGSTTEQGPTCDPAVKGNPPDIFDDPEFQALNPSYSRSDFPAVSLLNRGQFLPLVLSGNSDLTHELSRWLATDPESKAFIAGAADPSGMHVNSYYKDEALPLDQFQVLDPGYTAPPSGGTPGISTMQVTWNPVTGLQNVAGSLVVDRPSGINPTLPTCGTAGVPCVYQRFGSQPPGNRALFAIVGLNDAASDRFPTARLVNAAGKAVAPTDAGLTAGIDTMTTNADGITRAADFTSTDEAQYPLTTTEYAMVPTCGLSAAHAGAVQSFLDKVATSQTVGLQPGDLAPGNLALTSAQLAQVRTAATKVTAAACPTSNPGGGTHSPGSGSGTTTGGSTSTSGGNGFGNGGDGGNGGGFGGIGNGGDGGPIGDHPGNGDGSAQPSGSGAPSSSAAVSPQPSASLAAYGLKHDDSDADPGMILPILLIVLGLLVICGPGALMFLRTTGRRT